MKIHNFSAGPSILPKEVIEKTANAILNLNESGLSILEISHRSKDFIEIMQKAQFLTKKLLQLNDDYQVLFLQGGARLQFSMIPMNFLNQNASYIDTGLWANTAIKEAQKIGNVNVIASSKESNYNHIPKNFNIPENTDYLHLTSNNTIYGTQIKNFPTLDNIPLICDMSSDIFSRNLNFNQFGLIYAGIQKNAGCAGATMVIIHQKLLEKKTKKNLASYLDYAVHIEKESMFNTPPVLPIYTAMLTLEWLEKNGGISAIEQKNEEKAKILYQEIDKNTNFETFCKEKEDRSMMNVSFYLTDAEKKEKFENYCKDAGISGISGHRSLGGYRASIYNALPIESVKALIEVMRSI